MLMLLFYVGNDLYALDSSQVVEVIPRVALRKIHHSPDYVAGLFNYRGIIVPVIDLCHLIRGTSSSTHLGTRIVIVNYIAQEQTPHLLGLMAERITETLKKSDCNSLKSDQKVNKTSYLGEIIMDNRRMIQQIQIEYLLSESQQANLLPAQEN